MPPNAASFGDVLAETRRRRILYPIGSGQAEELALEAGLKPLVRQLLEEDRLEAAVGRFERSGFEVAVAPVRYVREGERDDQLRVTPREGGGALPRVLVPLFVGRDRAKVEAAAAGELLTGAPQARALGPLLGYPPCCVEAFATTPPPRHNKGLAARALDRTPGAPAFRLNTLDLRMFHYVAYSPCSFRCVASLRFADAVAILVARRHPAFARAIDLALGAHRLVVSDDVQVSLTGRREGDAIAIDRAWPTALDRHPDAALGAKAEAAVARLVVSLRLGRRLRQVPGGVELDGRPLDEAAGAMLFPFGEPSGPWKGS